MQGSGQSLPVFLNVSKRIFTFELQSESGANSFPVFLVFSALLVLVYVKLPIFEVLHNTWFY